MRFSYGLFYIVSYERFHLFDLKFFVKGLIFHGFLTKISPKKFSFLCIFLSIAFPSVSWLFSTQWNACFVCHKQDKQGKKACFFAYGTGNGRRVRDHVKKKKILSNTDFLDKRFVLVALLALLRKKSNQNNKKNYV